MRISEGMASMGRLAIAVSFAFVLTACSTQVDKTTSRFGGSGYGNGAGNYGEGARDRGPVVPGTLRDFEVNVGKIIYFTTDSSQLTSDAQATLAKQAQWLRRYPQFTITVEGHADERGTREYNLALGARRANSVRNYLASRGVNSARMRTISYGRERPVALCADISCWSQNRRAVTVLNNRAGS